MSGDPSASSGSEPITPKQKELEILAGFPKAVSFSKPVETGVLLSDQIQHYVAAYRMIDPFNPLQLKPASYELSVGELGSIGGKTHRLSSAIGERELTIEPFQVAIIQTLERVNIPNFLIARWNLRVKWAYRGLLWVGGPQVDPGFKGYLSCPLYNLSDKPVQLQFGEPIAVIDFVTTTTPKKGVSRQYPEPNERTRLIFNDYNPGMRSALATTVMEKLGEVEGKITDLNTRADARFVQMQNRIDQFTGITFAAITILVGAVAVIATKAPADFGWNFTSVLSVVAVFVTLVCVYLVKREALNFNGKRIVELGIALAIAVAALIVIDLTLLQPPLNKKIEQLQGDEKKANARQEEAQRQLSAIKNAAQLQATQRDVDAIKRRLKM